MSVIRRLKERLSRWALHHFAVPLINRELKERGIYLYRYVPAVDRLFPYRALTSTCLDTSGKILSDRWYRAVKARNLRVPVIFDVGVNYGYTSVWFSRWADRVYAFEPNPHNVAMIREQLRIRRVDNVELTQTAISDYDGEAVLHLKPFDGHHSLDNIGSSPTVGQMSVPVTTLDRVSVTLGIARIGLLKIDVEGFEPEVLRGASGLLSDRKIDLILFEFSPHFYRQRGLDPRAPLTVLQEYGYLIRTLDGIPVDFEPPSLTEQTDLLAEPPAERRAS